jgi:hypothetical protein
MEVSAGGTTLHLSRGRVVVLLVAVAFLAYGGYDYAEQREAVADAEAVEATVLNSTVVDDTAGRGAEYDARVEYRYGGTTHTNDDVFSGSTEPGYDTEDEARSVTEGYDDGAVVTAYVDPERPGSAFLERRATTAPLTLAGIGGVGAVLLILHAAGAQRPGRDNELVPTNSDERYATLAGVERGSVHRHSKRLMAVSLVVFFLSLITAVVVLLVKTGLEDVTVQADPLGPLGAPLVAAFVAYLALVASVLAYAVWSFTEYRRLRDRIRGDAPPSPFRHPTRLVTVALTDEGLDEYGRRVKYTALSSVFAGFLVYFLANLLV